MWPGWVLFWKGGGGDLLELGRLAKETGNVKRLTVASQRCSVSVKI